MKDSWSYNTADLGQPIFDIDSIHIISWWRRCLLYFLPTRHYLGDDGSIIYLKFWKGTVYLVKIKESSDV